MSNLSELKQKIQEKRKADSKFLCSASVKDKLNELFEYIDALNSTLQEFNSFKGTARITLGDKKQSNKIVYFDGTIYLECKDINNSTKIPFIFTFPDQLFIDYTGINDFNQKNTILVPDYKDLFTEISSIALSVMT